MKILAINWLDLNNPSSGGAEIHFFEIFKRLVMRGHEVTLLASGWAGASQREVVEGIDVRRAGSRYSFALKARREARKLLKDNTFDVVVEDINKVPLYSPTLTDLPVYVIVPHLFGTTVFEQASWPVASLVWLSERRIPLVYKHCPFHVISKSTRDDVVSRGIDSGSVRVIYPGVDSEWMCPDETEQREDVPTFLYTGRLQRYKGVETAIRAIDLLKQSIPGARLVVAGAGEDRARLEKITRSLGVVDRVSFLGYVSEQEKRNLMRRAWAVVFPSAKEGWGITNIEAAACGTPAIASDSPGLRETAIDNETGALVPHGQARELADAMVRFGSNLELVNRLGSAARKFALKFSWDDAATQTEEHLTSFVAHPSPKQETRWKPR